VWTGGGYRDKEGVYGLEQFTEIDRGVWAFPCRIMDMTAHNRTRETPLIPT